MAGERAGVPPPGGLLVTPPDVVDRLVHGVDQANHRTERDGIRGNEGQRGQQGLVQRVDSGQGGEQVQWWSFG